MSTHYFLLTHHNSTPWRTTLTLNGEESKVLGSTLGTVQSGEHSAILPLLVVKGNGPDETG